MIAVTGAAGFIGSNLAFRLAGLGQELWLVDHPFSSAKAANWVGLSRFCFATDALFLDALRSENPRIDAVFHLGACSSTTETNWEYLTRNNIEFSQKIWAWCAQAELSLLLRLERGHLWRRIARVRRPRCGHGAQAPQPLWQEQERLRPLGARRSRAWPAGPSELGGFEVFQRVWAP